MRDSVRLGLLLLCFSACSVPRAKAPTLPSAAERCRASAGLAQPIVAEWSAPERAQLSALLGRGTAIGVSYTGCELRLLPMCGPPGRYLWRRTASSTDEYAFSNLDELDAKLPLAAVELRATLQSQGGLRLLTTVAGQLELSFHPPESIGYFPACNEATHLVRSVAVGASELRSAASGKLSAGLEAFSTGVNGSSSSTEAVLHRSGDSRACLMATQESLPIDCAAPIQLFLEPISRALRPQVASAPLSVTFVSADSNVTWDVEADGRTLCQTPCSQVIDPTRAHQLRTGGGFMQQEQRVDVLLLDSEERRDQLMIRAKPRSMGKLGAGATVTTFGGLAFATGVTLLSVGYGTNDYRMGKAGVITFSVSPALLIPGIWLLVDSQAKAEVFSRVTGMAQ
jgi:hypothetical protein